MIDYVYTANDMFIKKLSFIVACVYLKLQTFYEPTDTTHNTFLFELYTTLIW